MHIHLYTHAEHTHTYIHILRKSAEDNNTSPHKGKKEWKMNEGAGAIHRQMNWNSEEGDVERSGSISLEFKI